MKKNESSSVEVSSVQQQSKDKIVNADGLSALSCLYCLLDDECLLPITKITFEFQSHHSKYEVIKLVLHPDDDTFSTDTDADTGISSKAKITLDMNRDLNHVSRRSIKQNLASLALIQLFDNRWMELSLKRMKSLLKE